MREACAEGMCEGHVRGACAGGMCGGRVRVQDRARMGNLLYPTPKQSWPFVVTESPPSQTKLAICRNPCSGFDGSIFNHCQGFKQLLVFW